MATKNEMRAVLKNKFLCQDKFTNDIENLVQNNNDMNTSKQSVTIVKRIV